MGTFQVDVPVYLGWLFARVLERGVSIRRHFVERIEDVWLQVEGVKAVFNCTGLGAYDLGGVEDRDMFPTRVSCFFYYENSFGKGFRSGCV